MITNEQLAQWHKEFENNRKRHLSPHFREWDDFVRWRQHRPLHRRIVIPDFDGPGDHLYEDQLGWQYENFQEVKTNVSRDLFKTYMLKWWHNCGFYYVDNDTLYGFHAEGNPVIFKKLARDRSQPYIGWQIGTIDTHEQEGEEILGVYEEPEEDDEDLELWFLSIWNTLTINGKTLEEVLERSYICYLSM